MQEELFPDLPADFQTAPAAPRSQLPFRTQFRTTTDLEIEQLNRRYNLKGSRAYLPTASAIDKARSSKSMVPARLEALLEHPDERVPAALIDNSIAVQSTSPNRFGVEGSQLRYLLYQRAIRDAESEGVVWTPVLDKLAAESLWPTADYSSYGRTRFSILQATKPLVSAAAQVEKLIPWIREQRDPGRLRSLLHFAYEGVLETVARYATCLDEALIDDLLQRSPHLGYHLAANPSLTKAQVDHLVRWAIAKLDDPSAIRRHRTRSTTSLPRHARDMLLELHEHGWLLDRTAREELLRIAQNQPVPKAPRKLDDSERIEASQAAKSVLLGLGDDLEPEILLRLYDAFKTDADDVRRIVAHPAATLEIRRHIVSECGFYQVRDYLSQSPELRNDPVIRAALVRSSAPSVLLRLCEDAEPSEFRRLFRKLARRDPLSALRLITAPGFDSKRLYLADLQVLLQDESAAASSRDRSWREKAREINQHLLLWLRRRPLADDPPGKEGEVAEAFARPRLESIIFQAFRSDHDRAINLIEHHAEIIKDLVKPDDLASLLASPDNKVRLAGMLLLSRLRTDPREQHDSPRITP